MIALESGPGGWAVVGWTVVIVGLSAFFVATEFALMAAKPHRLEQRAGSAAGRAAIKNSAELTLLLAGSQLGITICTLALGAVTKPAVHHALMPLLAFTGLPEAAADVVAFVLALLLVTFLHLVVGEMAPKSWAIAHPEDSSVLLALPMRAFMWLARPLLVGMNAAANWLVRRAGAEPVDDRAERQDPSGLRALIEHSANIGALDAYYREPLTQVLVLRERTAGDMVPPEQEVAAVGLDATLADVQQTTRRTRHLRVLVRDGDRTEGVVHVRDTLAADDLSRPALEVARDPVRVAADAPLTTALARLPQAHAQLAIVTDGGREVGVLSLEDVLPGLMPSAFVGAPDGGTPRG